MEFTAFQITYGLSAFTCLLVATGLLFLKHLRNFRNRKYRNARRLLALASAAVGASSLVTLLFDGSSLAQLGLLAFPVVFVGSSQSLLFTFMLILLFREKYVTRRNILFHASPSIVLTALYLAARCFAEDPAVFTFAEWAAQAGNPVLLVRSLFFVTYLVQLAVYTRIFFRERAIYGKTLRTLEQIPEQLELRWATRLFLYALGIGLLAATLCLILSTAYEMAITAVFTAFYLLTGFYYANYHFTYNFLRDEFSKVDTPLPEAAEEKAGLDTLVGELAEAQQKDRKKKEELLFEEAEKLMRDNLLFTDLDFDRKKLVQELCTNEHYLTRALKQHTSKSIQEYITSHRLNYAHTLLLIYDDPRSIASIAADAGFLSVRTFNRLFKDKFNQTPGEFRKEHAEQAKADIKTIG